MTYATAADYTDYTGQQVQPEDIERRLARASERVDELLISSVYQVDDAGMPIEPDVIEAMKKATCAQAAWTLAVGDEYGVASAFEQVSIGSVRLQRGKSGGGPPARYASDASAILQRAGLIPGYVIDGSPW
ncbi:hypothetical protein GCM10023194_81360 [Planotetraspora phitsanulokensis]|uniref:Head-to-tail adaptor n=1 Tax=Planotetraspora phitsanulokensis TaxID=575192 RepID=A0A8J3XNK5_9ACTN|nr:hypothetical protein [Planotetraspora phitsanulokensis]GII42933.1 hypothetical protein Pph01_79360 [Planotetraspora phitsanulokensis]